MLSVYVTVSHKLLSKVKEMLEEDAKNVLMFMASNGLVANPKKTAFMILNHKQDLVTNPITIIIGNEINYYYYYHTHRPLSHTLVLDVDDSSYNCFTQ